jgi:hexosaminidase
VRSELTVPRDVGVNYRIPPPGAVVNEGLLRANMRYPGMAIEFSTDGGLTWSPYTAPMAAPPSILLRARAADGRTSRVARID